MYLLVKPPVTGGFLYMHILSDNIVIFSCMTFFSVIYWIPRGRMVHEMSGPLSSERGISLLMPEIAYMLSSERSAHAIDSVNITIEEVKR